MTPDKAAEEAAVIQRLGVRVAALLRITVLVLLMSGIVLPQVLGYLAHDYSSTSNFISELGAKDAPFGAIANYFGFLPVGVAVVALVTALRTRLPQQKLVKGGLTCLLGVSIGYLGAAFFPCDVGCPATGTYRQATHNLAGLLAYVGGISGLFLLYFGLRSSMSGLFPPSTLVAACAVTLGVFLMFNPGFEHMLGASQRLADYSIFVWLCCAVLISTSQAGRPK